MGKQFFITGGHFFQIVNYHEKAGSQGFMVFCMNSLVTPKIKPNILLIKSNDEKVLRQNVASHNVYVT